MSYFFSTNQPIVCKFEEKTKKLSSFCEIVMSVWKDSKKQGEVVQSPVDTKI